MSESTVVIKINYDKSKKPVATAPEMVTVWHVKRIALAVSLLFLLIMSLVWLSDDEQPVVPSQTIETISLPTPQPMASVSAPVAVDKAVEPAKAESKPKPQPQPQPQPQVLAQAKLEPASKQPVAVILDKRVLRAALVAEVKDRIPGPRLGAEIVLTKNKPQSLYYYAEVKHLKNAVLFQHWLKNGRMVHKKQLDVKDDVAMVLATYRFSAKDKGEWQVRLTDKDGKSLSETRFTIKE